MNLFRLMAVTLCVLLFLAQGAFAQLAEDEFVPEGPRGRWSVEQAQVKALQIIEGELLSTDIEREDDHVFYEYTIRQFDGSIFEVEINAANGNIYEIEVEYLSDNAKLPDGLINEDLAISVAEDYTRERGRGRMKPRAKGVAVDIYERNLVYAVLVEKGVREYVVYVDAFDARALEFEEVD